MHMAQTPKFPGIEDPVRQAGSENKQAINYAEVLNPAQLEAVTYGAGPLLVIAGAGSGKTRTLTYRVARLVEDGVPPEAILLLSFTRKASQEMVKRATLLLDHRCQQVSGGTFHSFAHRILRRYHSSIGFSRNFSILDRSDSEDLIGLIRKEMGSQAKNRDLPRKSTLATIFSRSINKALSIEEVLYEDYPHFGHQCDLISNICTIYQQRKREHYFCDYDDLLTYLHQLLDGNTEIRNLLASVYQYILVDEYQDTNLIQAEIISLLAGRQRNVMVVGDDSQSIYAFRGANFKNIITFPDRFPGTRIIKLEQNYRSLQPILDLTNTMIEQAAEKYSKRLFTCRGGGLTPTLVGTATENAQSQYVAKEIDRLIGQGVKPNDIAVLFRASFHSFDLEIELTRSGIDFVKFGGFKFTESAHIKDVLAHLKILCTPKDRLSWYRILMLMNGVGPKTAQRLYESVIDQEKGAAGILDIPAKIKNSASLDRMKALISNLSTTPTSIQHMGELVVEYYLPSLKERYDDHPRRIRDLQQLLAIMDRYDDLQDFLADMALEPPTTSIEGRLAGIPEQKLRLNLSTIHSAKGLEWHTVFVIWALDGRFPSHHAIDKPEALEEERRLMYVATTRARENLHILFPSQVYDRMSQTVLYRPSRFLEGIPDHLLDKQFYDPSNEL
jgi:DNA helicase-2/ATP-dependent DNA helicase PcrA